MTTPFSIKEVFKAGWRTLRAHSGVVFAVVLTMFAIEVVQQIIEKTIVNTPSGVAASIVLSIASAVLGIGATVIALRLTEGKHATYRDIVPPWPIVWRTLLAGLLIAAIVIAPILVGVVLGGAAFFGMAAESFNFSEGVFVGDIPWGAVGVASTLALVALGVGIYLALRYSMSSYTIIDGAGVVESLRKSWRMTRGALPKLVLFMLAFMALNIVGMIPVGLGLLVTIPLTSLAMAHVYLKLKHRS